jgi:hypothetical protein
MAKTQAIQPGYCIAVYLVPDAAAECCYIGIVEATDDIGLLINLAHWDDKLDMVGGYSESLFVPWKNVSSALISTEQQPTRRFMADRAPKWKKDVEASRGSAGASGKKK